jgi:RNA polymerase sigma factor (sigma-70 family)
MRLVKSDKVRELVAPTPESVFAAKYEWLLRWAKHFTQNDQHAAEDLAQEAFVRLIVSWPRIKDNIDQVEAFLYSTLKYAHLMELRRGRRFNFQDLALIEFDDLRLSLQEEKTTDPIEVQDDLRRIVAYLCWRKRSAKSASVLLLRFIHGYYPDEIAQIAVMKRGPINELLRVAREEVKAYLADPSRVEIMRQGKPPELMPRQVAVPSERFAEELQTTIFEAQATPCPDRHQLLQRYQTLGAKPVPTELLAHIVSCKRCLHTINATFNFQSPTDRPSDGMVSSSRRSRRTGPSGPPSKEDIRRVMDGGKERFRKLYEHHPRGLMIAVNGDVLAMRDVNSATSELKVQTDPDKSLGIIDVLSEQGISLLTLYVPSGPPDAPPEVRHEILLSDDRKLELLLRFTSEGAVIELHYNDPFFLSVAGARSVFEANAESEETSETMALSVPEIQAATVEVSKHRPSWWRRVLHKMAHMAIPEMSPMFATAMVCAVAAMVFLFLSFHNASVMKPEELLTRSVSSEHAPPQAGLTGVVVQTVRIQTPRRKLERTLYRDVQGRRHSREQEPNGEDAALRTQLERAGISWTDPLSAHSFKDWHDRTAISHDIVKRTEPGLLTLTTTASGGLVDSESLTVRESDFHPVGRSVKLRDAGTVEIAELSYSVLPWSSVNPDLFDPLAAAPPVAGGGVHAALLPHLPMLPTLAQIDEAELGARLVLNRLHLDSSGRIQLSREADGVHVQGVVETDDEKYRLQGQLRLVSHVLPSILTVQEMAAQPSAGSEITSIRQTSVVAPEPSALERFFMERGLDKAAVGTSAQEFVDSSFTVRHESEQITMLLNRFSSDDKLSAAARTALSELLIQHKASLLAVLGKEERQLVALQLIPQPVLAAEGVEGNADALKRSADQNFTLCFDLTSGSTASSRSAQTIAPQLATSIAQLRAVVLHISAAAQMSAPPSANAANANQNQ